MPRASRYLPGGMVFHVLNRAVGRRTLFSKEADYLAFERVLEETLRTRPMRICAYCVMPNHWHFVLWPEHDGDLSAFLQQLTNTHVKRWKEHRREVGYGHLYQGRFKCFPVQTDAYFYDVVRYVERNALRANLVARAERWPWSSLGRGLRAEPVAPILADWPLPRPADWPTIVNRPQTESEIASLRHCVNRGRPYRRHRVGRQNCKNPRPGIHTSTARSAKAINIARIPLPELPIRAIFGACHEWHCRRGDWSVGAWRDSAGAGMLLGFPPAASDLVAIAALGYELDALLGLTLD